MSNKNIVIYHLIYLFMQHLNEIILKNAVKVQMTCDIDQEVLGKNFGIIMDCLKQLQSRQDGYDKQLKELSSLKDLIKDLQQGHDRLQAISQKSKNSENQQNGRNETEKANIGNNNDNQSRDISKKKEQDKKKEKNETNAQGQNSSRGKPSDSKVDFSIQDLKKQVQKNGSNIDENIKDINLIYAQLKKLKEQISNIGQQKDSAKNESSENSSNKYHFQIDSVKDIHNQILKNKEFIEKTNAQLDALRKQLQKAKQRIQKNETDISELQNRHKNNGDSNKNSNNNSNLGSSMQDLRDRLEQLSKKVANNIISIDRNSSQIEELNEKNIKLDENDQKQQQQIDKLWQQINSLKKSIEQIQGMQSDEMKKIKSQLSKLSKKSANNAGSHDPKQKIHSNTSLEDTSVGPGTIKNALYTQNRFMSRGGTGQDQDIKQLKDRLEALEKYITGSKNSIAQEKSNSDNKLPLIKRPLKAKDTHGHSHDKSTAKKDFGELKNQIIAWIKSYIDANKQKSNWGDIELILEQIKNVLNKKADQEGLRKGLTFLENKINQLYLFLTEPDTEDAMIVRKGFNCLSCSKKVEKLRGNLGPHMNWNNLTHTSYSPPKVGYSKPMQDNSQDRESEI